VLGRDPRQRSQNNVALLTASADYDAVFVADATGEFAREVPYQIQKPRPVVGAAGLVPDWWSWAWERHGAPQLNRRFLKAAKRPMTGYDWSAWMGVKAVVESVVRTAGGDFPKVRDYMLSDALILDGFNGYRLDFRAWDHQLRLPVFLTTLNWVVARAPLEGFLHQSNNLDTLGFDEKDSRCRLSGG
jgi:ABC transporter substrate binding protein (PQQ-dependent alcohol dehydrogenase system)